MCEVESGIADSVVLSLCVSAPFSLIIESVNRLFFKKNNIQAQEFWPNICIQSQVPDIVININLPRQFEQITEFALLFRALKGS